MRYNAALQAVVESLTVAIVGIARQHFPIGTAIVGIQVAAVADALVAIALLYAPTQVVVR
ncbi:hypothetical protein D3C75_1283480 [compost metagenome]